CPPRLRPPLTAVLFPYTTLFRSPVHKRIFLLFFRNLSQAALKIIDDGKYLFHNFFGADHIHAGFFFFRAFSVVVEFCQLPFQLIRQFLYFFLLFIFFFFFLSDPFLLRSLFLCLTLIGLLI